MPEVGRRLRARRWASVAAVNLLTLAVMLVAADWGARRLCHAEFEALFSRRARPLLGDLPVEPHPRRGTALKPGYRDDLYRVNADGFRGAELPPDLDRYRLIAAIGDSTTFGWGVGEGEDYPSRLMERLRRSGLPDVYVVNAGVPGYTSSQTLAYLRELLAGPLGVDLVVASVLWNDVWYSTVAEWHPSLLLGQPPAAWRRWLRDHSGLYRCFAVSRAARSDQVDVFNAPAFDRYRSNVEEMARLARRQGTRLILLEPPFDGGRMPKDGLNRFHIRYTRSFFIDLAHRHLDAVAEVAERHGVPVVPHRLSIDSRSRRDLFLDTLHPNAQGNDLMAEDVAAFLIENHVLEDLEVR